MIIFLISISLGLLAVAAAVHALLSKRDSISALAWVAFCLLLPLVGPVTYVLFGINRTTAKAQREYVALTEEDSAECITEPPGTTLRPISFVGEQLTGSGLRSCEDIEILENGEALYPAMFESINAAEKSVYCATYIFQNDSTGRQIADALKSAQDRGLDVRLIIDGLGAIAYSPRISGYLRELKLNFKHFNPIKLIPPSLNINMRNHRKILITDGATCYTGGQNIGDRHLVDKVDNDMPTRDLHFRLRGKIVDDMSRAFLKDWNYCSGIKRRTAFTPNNVNTLSSDNWARLILDGPNENLDKLNELLVGVFSAAQERVWIMTPYFLPGLDLFGAILGAKLRGVDVKILLPERTNIHMAHFAATHGIGQLIAKDLKVYLQPSPFIHTKAILVDNNYAMVGSANLDPRSLRLNYELGVEIFSESFNEELTAYFSKQLERSPQLTQAQLNKRPRWIRIRDAAAWLFSPYL